MAMWWRDKSFEVLPALSVRRRELRQSLRTVTIAWMYGVVWMSCISGDQVRAFCRMLGFNDFAFGLLAAVPFVATFGQLPASIIVERTGLRKYLFLYANTVHRLLWIAVAAIPLFLPLPSATAVAAMLIVLAVSNFLGAVATPAWWTWMGDLIPRRIRGRYFARRSQLTQGIQVLVVLALGVIMDAVTRPDAPTTAADQPMLLWTVSATFVIAAIFGAADILLFLRIREVIRPIPQMVRARGAEPLQQPTARKHWFANLLMEPLRDRVFRHYVLYGATITFTMSVAGWYFWLFSTEGLGFSKFGANLLFLVIGPIAGILTAKGWGKLIDRLGRRPVLIISTLGATVAILPWFFARRDMPSPAFLQAGLDWFSQRLSHVLGGAWPTLGREASLGAYLLASLGCVIGGASWTGVSLAQTAVVLKFADGSGRSKYVAASSVLVSIGGALGGLVGGAVAQSLSFLQDQAIIWGPFVWNNWHATFAISLVVRAFSLLWLVDMPDPGARMMRDIFRDWSSNAYNLIAGKQFYRLRIFGWERKAGRSGAQPGRKK